MRASSRQKLIDVGIIRRKEVSRVDLILIYQRRVSGNNSLGN